jgi:hypothetical protein
MVHGLVDTRQVSKGKIMSSKHAKPKRPSDVDLDRNPLIGGSNGVTMAHATPDELEDLEGANTIEGDVYNDTNPEGGIEMPRRRQRRARSEARAAGPRKANLQGKKTHEQQLRMLERKPDVPDARQLEDNESIMDSVARLPKRQARQSEFPLSYAGMNQESKHNKHNRRSQAGHKPQKPRANAPKQSS